MDMADFLDGVVDPKSDITGILVGSNRPSEMGELYLDYNWIPLAFLNLILQSAFIPNTKILSTFFISNAGLGKTTYLEFLKRFDFIDYVLDITPTYIVEFLRDVEHGRKKFLVTPDYITFLGHNKKTIDLAQSYFRAMIEEGASNIKTYNAKIDFDIPVKAGIISGITVDKANENTGRWKSDGFYSRLLPFSYSHSIETQNSILNNIFLHKEIIDRVNMKIVKNPQEPVWNESIDSQIKIIAFSLSDNYTGAVYRKYKQILSLCKSSAILRDSNTVEHRDIMLVQKIANYINRVQHPL